MKLMFENRFGVRLHGTPNPALFDRWDRALSYGCIRVENPLILSAALLRSEGAWPLERVETVARGRRETGLRLTSPVPIHITYFTARVDERGRLHFPPDLYQRDGALDRELGRLRERFGSRSQDRPVSSAASDSP